jgi:hypothetical protein
MKTLPMDTPKTGSKTEIFICDLDGCIWDQAFPSLNGDPLLDGEREELVQDLNERLREIDVYPNFIRYFRECSPKQLIFITGRKKEDFGDVTTHQLKLLRSEKAYTDPIYYPPNADHTQDAYLSFKVDAIIALLPHIIRKYPNSKIKIFDDNQEYFERLHSLIRAQYDHGVCLDISTYWIQSNEDWSYPEDHQILTFRRGFI